ncbi:hypothetical protein HPDFL43_13450 [Hoeflea phototrophica DFL-43]|uniref:Uncharacterized protein n=1 Tax=Hoeflea phototrophica (strain DSM 17068 / NCIMB 14078 / DFL-43) TaxID=411684 RepID=A9DE65_HOEPD|nr:hypothetical protein HPDFL43_13450 [Hoeflea phototrophica DFL-43]
MGKVKLSDDFERDGDAQITERGYSVVEVSIVSPGVVEQANPKSRTSQGSRSEKSALSDKRFDHKFNEY